MPWLGFFNLGPTRIDGGTGLEYEWSGTVSGVCSAISDGRLTLVIEQSAPSVKVLWSVMATNTLEHAIESLRLREGTARKHIDSWEYTADDPEPISGLSIWARSIGADAVIWTALPPKFSGKNHVVPSLSQAMEYLNSLNEEAMGLAEDYIRKAPPQIRTPYRNAFEVEFGWK